MSHLSMVLQIKSDANFDELAYHDGHLHCLLYASAD